MLTACYDLAKCPPTFDVVTFLLRAEFERIARGEESIAIEILPGPEDGFRRDPTWPQSIEMRRKMLNAIVLPMCAMLPSALHVTLYSERPPLAADTFGFNDYSMRFQYFLQAIGNCRPLRPRFPYEGPKNLVTMTLREAEHHSARNSNVAEWRRAAINLRAMGFKVIIVRDTAKASEPLGDLMLAPDASHNLEERAALYRAAACNMFISNGPAWFALALDAPVVMLRPTTEGCGMLNSAEGMARMGLPTGGQPAGLPAHQRLVWEDDSFSNIVAACCRFMDETRLADVG